MSQVIRISDSTYEELESMARGFDTPGNVIDRLLDFYRKHATTLPKPPPERCSPPISTQVITPFDPDSHPDLTHTKVLDAQFGNEKATTWMDLVYVAHKYALKQLGSFDALKKVSPSNIFKGSLNERGYHDYKDVGISIQGQDSNDSWNNALQLAREANVSIEVPFQWRNKKGAARPGQSGSLSWQAR